jgi:catechol 2,3-dioxygenase-like lactoylglutathione lyase family enzyme
VIDSLPRIGIAVRDMDAAVRTFRDGFGMPTHEFAWAPEKLGARMALCCSRGNGSHVELFAPGDPARSHSQVFLRFLERRGEGLYAMMLNAPDPNAEAEALARRGLSAMPLMPEAGGRDLHPRDTCGVLIRIYPTSTNEWVDPELERELGPAVARFSATGLTTIRRVLVAVRDFDAAVAVYRDRLGFETVIRPEEWAASVRQAIATPREGARIELLAPARNRGPIAEVLREHGEGMFALVLESEDLEASVRALRERGISAHPAADDSGAWEIDRTTAFGVRFRLESATRAHTGEPPWS